MIPTFKTLIELYKATAGHQLTAQEIINGRTKTIEQGWTPFDMTDELREECFRMIVNTLGGQTKTKASILNKLRYSKPQHWGLSRTVLEKHEGRPFFSYIAGQDCTYEKNEIRKVLK